MLFSFKWVTTIVIIIIIITRKPGVCCACFEVCGIFKNLPLNRTKGPFRTGLKYPSTVKHEAPHCLVKALIHLTTLHGDHCQSWQGTTLTLFVTNHAKITFTGLQLWEMSIDMHIFYIKTDDLVDSCTNLLLLFDLHILPHSQARRIAANHYQELCCCCLKMGIIIFVLYYPKLSICNPMCPVAVTFSVLMTKEFKGSGDDFNISHKDANWLEILRSVG